MNQQSNKIEWRRVANESLKFGDTLFISRGEFEWAGAGTFWIAYTKTIGKPYALNFASNYGNGDRQFLGAFATVSGAKQRAKKFGTWGK